MKRFRKNTRGQFVVVAALLIALLTLSVALSISQVNLHRQQLRYEPVEELVLGITSDLDRCLAHALSIATQQYYNNMPKGDAVNEGYNFISKWVRSILASHSHLGVKMNMSVPNPTEGGRKDVDFDLGWYKGWGRSQVYTKFDLDVDAYGFKGWVGHSGKLVKLTIFPESITPADQNHTTLKFQIMQGKDQPTSIPIPNLTPESLIIWVNITRTLRVPANVTALSYLGGGNYNVTFSPRIYTNYTFWVGLTAITPEDNIYVSTYLDRYVNVSVALDSREENDATQHLGRIQLGDITYTLPNSTSRFELGFPYLLRYTPENGYTFLNWTTTGDVQVANSSSIVTSVKINGNGSITAFYSQYIPRQPKIVNVNLDSRERNNQTQHLGNITLKYITYTLPATVTIQTKDYPIEYTPENSSYYFWWWEWSPLENFIFENSSAKSTTLTIRGDGTVIAVYGTLPPPTQPSVFVNLRSREETSPIPTDLGLIRLSGVNYTLPVFSLRINVRNCSLQYFSAEGYDFLYWSTTENINVQNSTSSLTTVTINGNGTITAIYRGCKVFLDSRDYYNSSFHLGTITLGTVTYTLPKNLTGLPRDNYTLQYTPHNSSYRFIMWESSGDVFPWNSTISNTTLTVYGDGTVIAVYILIQEGEEEPPPPPGPWDTLFVDVGRTIVPPFMVSGKSSHISSWASTGRDKQIVVLDSPPTPTIYLARYVKVIAYLRINPPENAKDVTMELGFTYDGTYYKLGSGTFPVNARDIYELTIDTLYGEFPEGYFGIIPEGSVITLTITVTFFKEPWGTFFLYYGPDNPSRIELF